MFLVKQVRQLNHEDFFDVLVEETIHCSFGNIAICNESSCICHDGHVLFATVLPLLNNSQSASVYFILHNGSDTSDCGGSADSACFSLIHVLMLHYAEPPTGSLTIVIDMPLKIDNNFMVSSKLCYYFETLSDSVVVVLLTCTTSAQEKMVFGHNSFLAEIMSSFWKHKTGNTSTAQSSWHQCQCDWH